MRLQDAVDTLMAFAWMLKTLSSSRITVQHLRGKKRGTNADVVEVGSTERTVFLVVSLYTRGLSEQLERLLKKYGAPV